VGYDFVDTYEIPIVAGRNFSREFPSEVRGGGGNPSQAGALLLNETAVKRFGWDDPIGKEVIQVFGELRLHYTVIGVLKDFHYSSLRNPIMPMKLFLGRNPSRLVSIKIQPQDVRGTLERIEKAWNQFNPNYPFDFYFYDSVFAQRYREERNLQTLFRYFSALAIFIGCLGLFGLASFAAEQRTKEIGIRKILGASSWGMVILMSKAFIKWVLVANLIAWPVAYYAMSRWLTGYAYHTTLDLWIFLVSGVLALTMALLTVSTQAIRAASANPVNALKYE
jgi:putative ABC transport system permease protein